MPPQYCPTDEEIRDHLAQVEATAHLPYWKRWDASLELLLGLRRPTVDTELRRIVPSMEGAGHEFSLKGDFVLDVLTDTSEQRIARIVGRTSSHLPLAWFQPSQGEATSLIVALTEQILRSTPQFGVPSALFVSLCELASRCSVSVPDNMRGLTPSRWLEQSAMAKALGTTDLPTTSGRVAEPEWIPSVPQALLRDGLTGLFTRNVLARSPHRLGLRESKQLLSLPTDAVVMLDVDRMKQILDYHGMRTGDAVLRTLADHFQRMFGDSVIRYGGDEFLIPCARTELREMGAAAVESVRSLTVATFEDPDEKVAVTVSAGLASGPDTTAVLHAADEALSRAKHAGRDQVAMAEP